MRSWPAREGKREDSAIHFRPVRNEITNLDSTGKEPRMGFLQGSRILVTGMLSNRSIAYGIAKACRREGAELAFTYAGEGLRERVVDLAQIGRASCRERV